MESKYIIIGGAVLLVLAVIGLSAVTIMARGNGTGSVTQSVTPESQESNAPSNSYTGEVQDVTLRVVGGRYVLEPSTLKKGVPVRMTADLSTVVGCSRDIVISAFGVRKYVSQGDNVIEFTPTKTGTINIACSMNMYRGTFVVSDGVAGSASTLSASATLAAQQVDTTASSGSCGAGSGCGCGARNN